MTADMRLSICLATRGRPELLRPTLAATLPNIARADTRLVVAVDDDDAATIAAIPSMPRDERIAFNIAPREDAIGEKCNRVLTAAPADVYLYMVDYAPHVTAGFDTKIIEAAALYPDGYAVVYNRLAECAYPEINAVTHKLARAMGGIYPSHFPYWFTDAWLDDIARMIDRIVFVDVALDRRKKPETIERREPQFWLNFFKATHRERARIAEKIIRKRDFRETRARKQALLRNFALTEQRGAMMDFRTIASDASTDERYRRIKGKALAFAEAIGAPLSEVLDEPEAAMPSLAIACASPRRAYGGAAVAALFDVTRVMGAHDVAVQFVPIGGTDIDVARRDALAHWYAGTDASHLLLFDDGLDFPGELVLDMVEFDKPLVGAVYPQLPMQWAGYFRRAACRIVDGFLEMDGLAGGLLLVRRDCADAILQAFPALRAGDLSRQWQAAAPPQHRRADGSTEIWANVSHVITHIDGGRKLSGRFADEIKQRGGVVVWDADFAAA